MELNKYIDFDRLFTDLYKDHSHNILEWDRFESLCYKNLLEFYLTSKKDFDLIEDECEFNDKEIVFVYGFDFNDANESNNQSTTAEYVIIYNRKRDDFTSCRFEQG